MGSFEDEREPLLKMDISTFFVSVRNAMNFMKTSWTSSERLSFFSESMRKEDDESFHTYTVVSIIISLQRV